MIGSHLDTVPDAGKFDGVLGVLLGVAAVQALGGRRLPFGIDVIGFSEEEGIRYRAPFLGSQAICGQFDRELLDRIDARAVSMAEAFRAFGLDPDRIAEAAYPPGRIGGYLEVHIEQGPVLESRGAPVGVVTAISGQSRLWAEFRGRAGHAGTLPMQGRRDALAAAAELVLEVERLAQEVPELRATVGTLSGRARAPSMSCQGQRGFASTCAMRTTKPERRPWPRFDTRAVRLARAGPSRLGSSSRATSGGRRLIRV